MSRIFLSEVSRRQSIFFSIISHLRCGCKTTTLFTEKLLLYFRVLPSKESGSVTARFNSQFRITQHLIGIEI